MTDIQFAERIKKFRKSLDLTMEEFGNEIGKSKSTISLWESGRRSPKMVELNDIADVFGVSPTYLMGLTDDDAKEYSEVSSKKTGIRRGDFSNRLPIQNIFDGLGTENKELLYSMALKLMQLESANGTLGGGFVPDGDFDDIDTLPPDLQILNSLDSKSMTDNEKEILEDFLNKNINPN